MYTAFPWKYHRNMILFVLSQEYQKYKIGKRDIDKQKLNDMYRNIFVKDLRIDKRDFILDESSAFQTTRFVTNIVLHTILCEYFSYTVAYNKLCKDFDKSQPLSIESVQIAKKMNNIDKHLKIMDDHIKIIDNRIVNEQKT